MLLVFTITEAAVGDALKGIWPVTDKGVMKSLNGTWSLKVVEGIDGKKAVPEEDDSWGEIPVPGCWESLLNADDTSDKAIRFCRPTYSFPDSLTGYYRTEFTVPTEWKDQRVCIRLDGVLRGYDLWINNKLVGSWELPYNTCIFDLTPYLTKKAFRGEQQQLAMRVYTRYPGYEFDCFDDWTPQGIFRDVTLFCVPKTHLSDLTVTTKTDGTVTIQTEVAGKTKNTQVCYEILDKQGRVVSTGEKIANPQLWTPETPYLYTLRVYVKEKGKVLQTFTQKIGLREVSIDGKVLKLNGQAVKLRGVTCHSTDPVTVKVVSEDLTLKDMKMMKEASVNYIRTSHYPREPRFFELADSLGFYVVCEVPFGSRGREHLKDEAFMDNLKTRTLATITRHKNHPSVVIWSLGNENPLTDMCVRIGEYAKQLDPLRPICYPQTNGTMTSIGFGRFPKVADIYAPHYPKTEQVQGLFQKSNRPVIFTEYLHSLGISFEDHYRQWETIEQTPCLAGGSIWEWVDQGMPFRGRRTDRYGFEERVFTTPTTGFDMQGNKGTDGLLYADRTPLPNYYEMQRNYAQAFVSLNHSPSPREEGVISVTNRYDFINLKDNITFQWTLTEDRDTVAQGAFSPDCAPHTSVPYTLALPILTPGRLAILNVETRNQKGWTLLRQSFKLQGTAKPTTPLAPWRGVGGEAPLVRVGRKVTLSEVMKVNKARIARYLQPIENKYVKAEIQQEGATVSYSLTPDTTAKHYIGEMGIAYLLPKEIDRVQWIGQGPFASYPARERANRYGFWAKHKDDLYFEGNHMGIDACWLSDKDGNGVLISGDSLKLNFEQTDRGIVVTVNAAVSGVCPKFGASPFGLWSNKMKPMSGSFQIFQTKAGDPLPHLFKAPTTVPEPFRPFYTQYDTYLMKWEDISAVKLPAPIFIVAGQSNADGRIPMSQLPDNIKEKGYQHCLWSYGSGDMQAASGTFEPYRPHVAKQLDEDRWGFDAVVYQLLEQSLRQPFYVIKQTMGGTAIDPRCERSTHGNYWSADPAFLSQTTSAGKGGKSLLKALTEQIDACIDQQLSRLPQGYEIRALLWHQGEGDKPQADSYHDNLQQVVAYIRQHLVEKTGNPRYTTLPVVCGNFAKNSRQGSAKVAAALNQLAQEDKNFHVVDASDLTLQRDQLHFDAKGAEMLGRRFYEKLVELGIII